MRFNLKINEKDALLSLGQLVRFYRLQNNLSLRDLGSIVKISHTLISNIEKGKVSPNIETLSDILRALGIQLNDSTSMVAEFIAKYDEVFNYLYEYEISKATIIMNGVIEKEETYIASVCAPDYLSLKLFFLALRDELYGENQEFIELMYQIKDYFGESQKQLFNLTYGIYQYNKGFYKDAETHLIEALKQGSKKLDLLVNVYMVKVHLKMFRFMDVIKLGETTIVSLETDLLYLRAMEVRLSLAYANIIVKKHKEAIKLLDKVYRFAKFYNAIYLLSECDLLYSAIYFKEQKYDLAMIKVNQVLGNNPFVFYIRMSLAYYRQDMNDVWKYYKGMKEVNAFKQIERSDLVFDLAMRRFGLLEMTDKTFLTKVVKLNKLGKKACDLELIESSYKMMIDYYKEHRLYKKALDASEEAREIRKYGCR